MTQISKAEVINCEEITCRFNDADVCFAGPELHLDKKDVFHPTTERIGGINAEPIGALLRCKSYVPH